MKLKLEKMIAKYERSLKQIEEDLKTYSVFIKYEYDREELYTKRNTILVIIDDLKGLK